MSPQQSIIIVLLTGLLLIIIAVTFTALEDVLKNPVFFKYSLMAIIILTWLFVIFVSDLYLLHYKLREDVKNYQKLNHGTIMQNYIDTSNAQCPTPN